MPNGIPAFRDVDGNVVGPFYTHGSWLRDADNIDRDLKGLLIRCLADQPAHRPSLQELSKYLYRADRILTWNEDPDDRDWFDQVVNEPPDPPQDPQAPQVPEDGPQATGTRIYNLLNAAGARLQALSGVWSSERPPPPPPPPPAAQVPLSDDVAYLFSPNMDSLALSSTGIAVVNPTPDAALDPVADAGERAADRLPVRTPVRPPSRSGGGNSSTPASGPNGTAYPTPLSVLTRTNITSMDSQSNDYLSGEESDSPDIFLTTHDPATLDSSGGRAGIPREIVISLSRAGPLGARDLLPIPAFPPGTAPPAPPQGYQYGRASPSPALAGQVVPPGMFTIRIDRIDPARGRAAPNVFYRDLNLGGPAPRPGDNNAANNVSGGNRPRSPTVEVEEPRLPRVTARRIPFYGLFERPPARPRGFHYGRRLYLSPAEISGLERRGVRAPPGRMIIRLVHVDVAEGDSYERPTIFYQMEPRFRAPLPPSDDPEANILYATLPVS
ncbi:hypothetical protein SLS64_013429 [Diaporthe eres]